MCGIYGIFSGTERLNFNHLSKIKTLRHRGPDHFGYWLSEDKNVGFAHARLSIFDTSPSGNQPMTSKSGRYTISYNGECYNFKEIKSELNQNYEYVSSSDTEVILAGFEEWGVIETVNKIVGMFAFSVYDKDAELVYCFRDRVGEKPLYYRHDSKASLLEWGSELKTLSTNRNFPICDKALNLYIKYGYIPSPYSIYAGIYKLLPGHYLEINLRNNDFFEKKYWSPDKNKLKFDEKECVEQLNNLIVRTFAEKLDADVPVGVFLSGGIDSSLVSAVIQRDRLTKIDTYSIGFSDDRFDETKYSKSISKYIGTNHHEMIVHEEAILNLIDDGIAVYDEPFADVSQYLTLILSKFVRKSKTVALSGDGGDELFGGYNKYIWGARAISLNERRLTQLASPLFRSNFVKNFLLSGIIEDVLPRSIKGKDFKHRVRRLYSVLGDKDFLSIVDKLNSGLSENLSIKAPRLDELIKGDLLSLDTYDLMMFLDMRYFMSDDVLVKVDRASMKHSLEVRAPLLDHRIIEFALKVPSEFKIREEDKKWILKQVLYRYVPEKYFNRPKSGFSLPLLPLIREMEYFVDGQLPNIGNLHPVFDKIGFSVLWRQYKLGKNVDLILLWRLVLLIKWFEKNS